MSASKTTKGTPVYASPPPIPMCATKTPQFVKLFTSKLVNLIATEINKPEMQVLVRQNIVIPVINLLYTELYPYIIVLVATISIILILSFLTFMFFMVFYFRK